MAYWVRCAPAQRQPAHTHKLSAFVPSQRLFCSPHHSISTRSNVNGKVHCSCGCISMCVGRLVWLSAGYHHHRRQTNRPNIIVIERFSTAVPLKFFGLSLHYLLWRYLAMFCVLLFHSVGYPWMVSEHPTRVWSKQWKNRIFVVRSCCRWIFWSPCDSIRILPNSCECFSRSENVNCTAHGI